MQIMPNSVDKEDLRVTKTEKALNTAMFSLLENRRFGKITVSDICVEALVSRATFYAHYTDKYDILKEWLVCLKPDNINIDDPYEKIENIVNLFIHKNEAVIKNLVYDANDETLGILFDSILFAFGLTIEKENSKISPKHVVLSNFFAGGILNYVIWQVKNRFPSDVPMMNMYLYEAIENLKELNNKNFY